MPIEFQPDNRLKLLQCGVEYFPALLAAIDAAEREIFLESYIFADDDVGRAVAAALARAAQRGVLVQVLVDGFGGGEFPRTLAPEMQADGVRVLIYRPEIASLRGRFRLKRHRLRRLHRKLAVIDCQVAFVGGINIESDFNVPGHTAPRYDFAVQVEGPLVAAVRGTMVRVWEIVVWANFRHRYRVGQLDMPVPVASSAVPRQGQRAALLIRDNLRHRRDIPEAYLEAIAAAQQEVVIANAYFLPGRRLRHALMDAAQRGVSVIVLLQGRVEYRLQHYATQALYGALLAAGVRIFEYRASFLHAKVGVVDGVWATVGSANMDPFSLLLAREANVVAHDRPFAAELRERLGEALGEDAREVRANDWRRLGLVARGLRWTAYYMVRIGLSLVGLGDRY